MNNPEILQMFADVGAIITNSHVVYASGRHGSVYLNKDTLYLHTRTISTLCQKMAQFYDPEQIDVVVGPVLGGIVLSQWVAYHLNVRRQSGETLTVYAEKEEKGTEKQFFLRRGYDKYIPGKNVLVVEDVLTTGDSARRVIELVRAYDGNVIGLSALCNRGDVQPEATAGVPIQALVSVLFETFPEEECPLCKQQIPINTMVGKGKAFLSGKKVIGQANSL